MYFRLSGYKSAVHDRCTYHDLESLPREVEKVPSFLKNEWLGSARMR
jgi:hypothetical protein